MPFPLLVAVAGRSMPEVVPTPMALGRLILESGAASIVVQSIAATTAATADILEADLTARRLVAAALSGPEVSVKTSRLSFHRGVFDLEVNLSWPDRSRD